MTTLDHMILTVNDIDASVAFYTEVMGFGDDGEDEPFRVMRVNAETTLQLAPWGTDGGHHLAFAMTPDDFNAAFARVRAAGIEYGDSYHEVGNMRGPGAETGARGPGQAVYFFDPSRHLIEIRTY